MITPHSDGLPPEETMTDLVAFIKARLDDDQINAELVTSGGYQPAHWASHRVEGGDWAEIRQHELPIGARWAVEDAEVTTVGLIRYGRNEDLHVTRWDPERVVAEIAVKRALLEAFDLSQSRELSPDAWLLLKPVVFATAALWADHPDYDPTWKVTE